MIRPLRARHRWLVPLIAFATALVIAWALAAHRAASEDSRAPGLRPSAPPEHAVEGPPSRQVAEFRP